jgi:hypothetical protein
MGTKICSKCKILQDLDNFCKDSKSKDSKQSYCKICKSKSINEYYKTNPKKRPKKTKKQKPLGSGFLFGLTVQDLNMVTCLRC